MQEALRPVELEAERETVSGMADRGDGGGDSGGMRGDSDSIGAGHELESLEDVFGVTGLAGATAAVGGDEDTVYGTALDDADAPPPLPPLLALSKT